jgi:guanylate kinase
LLRLLLRGVDAVAPARGSVDLVGVWLAESTPDESVELDTASAQAAFAEHARYAGQQYGTLLSELEREGDGDGVVMLEIELQGARQIRESMPEALQVFIAPPSFETLRERLVGRGTDSPQTIDERLSVARDELEAQNEFSEVIVNDRVGDAVDALEALVQSQLGGAVD